MFDRAVHRLHSDTQLDGQKSNRRRAASKLRQRHLVDNSVDLSLEDTGQPECTALQWIGSQRTVVARSENAASGEGAGMKNCRPEGANRRWKAGFLLRWVAEDATLFAPPLPTPLTLFRRPLMALRHTATFDSAFRITWPVHRVERADFCMSRCAQSWRYLNLSWPELNLKLNELSFQSIVFYWEKMNSAGKWPPTNRFDVNWRRKK